MYKDSYSEEITRKLAKLKKKDPVHYSKVRIKSILSLKIQDIAISSCIMIWKVFWGHI